MSHIRSNCQRRPGGQRLPVNQNNKEKDPNSKRTLLISCASRKTGCAISEDKLALSSPVLRAFGIRKQPTSEFFHRWERRKIQPQQDTTHIHVTQVLRRLPVLPCQSHHPAPPTVEQWLIFLNTLLLSAHTGYVAEAFMSGSWPSKELRLLPYRSPNDQDIGFFLRKVSGDSSHPNLELLSVLASCVMWASPCAQPGFVCAQDILNALRIDIKRQVNPIPIAQLLGLLISVISDMQEYERNKLEQILREKMPGLVIFELPNTRIAHYKIDPTQRPIGTGTSRINYPLDVTIIVAKPSFRKSQHPGVAGPFGVAYTSTLQTFNA